MGNLLRSRDDMINLAQTYGVMRRVHVTKAAATTAANSTSGKTSAKRYPNFPIPSSFGAGVTAAYLTYCKMTSSNSATNMVAGLEVELGSLAVSTNTFTSGSSMPTKTIEGSSVTTASIITMLVATVAVTATTPTITITYTDQDGNTGQTCSMTLPTNILIDTAFLMSPHYANGDTGIRAVTNMSISTGSAGTLKVYGLLPQAWEANSGSAFGGTMSAMTGPFPMVPFATSEKIGFYHFGTVSANDIMVSLCLSPDN